MSSISTCTLQHGNHIRVHAHTYILCSRGRQKVDSILACHMNMYISICTRCVNTSPTSVETSFRRQVEGRQKAGNCTLARLHITCTTWYTCTMCVNILPTLFVVKKITGVVVITGPLQFSLQTTPLANPTVFTLTCVSTGGPATTVTWTRDGAIVSNDANHVFTKTVTDQLTSTYCNTLTVTGREPGNYTCSVANVRTAPPATASLTVAGE